MGDQVLYTLGGKVKQRFAPLKQVPKPAVSSESLPSSSSAGGGEGGEGGVSANNDG